MLIQWLTILIRFGVISSDVSFFSSDILTTSQRTGWLENAMF